MSPMMDMSAALTNPYTLDTCVVARRTLIVDTYGVGKQIVNFKPIYAVIFPDGDNNLSRRPDAETQVKSLTVITKYALRPATGVNNTDEYLPDLVKWNGSPFLVHNCEDYSHYGTGFIWANCTALPLTQWPPETK